MSRLITKQEKKIVLDKKGKDYVVIRPLSNDEMMAMSDDSQPIMLEEYLMKVRELLDRDPNEELLKVVEKHIAEIKKADKEKDKKSKEYNDNLLLKSIVKIVDDGKSISDHSYYISNIDNFTYQKLIAEIIKLNIPTQDKIDFLK